MDALRGAKFLPATATRFTRTRFPGFPGTGGFGPGGPTSIVTVAWTTCPSRSATRY